MDPIEKELRQAILNNPEDMQVRLVFADYLEEVGRTGRADFIRVQCECYRMTWQEQKGSGLVDRQSQLFYTLKDLVDELPPHPGIQRSASSFCTHIVYEDIQNPLMFRWVRGMVERVELSELVVEQKIPEWLLHYPLQNVKLYGQTPASTGSEPKCYWEMHSHGFQQGHQLPRKWFDHLGKKVFQLDSKNPKGKRWYGNRVSRVYYDSKEEAWQDLSNVISEQTRPKSPTIYHRADTSLAQWKTSETSSAITNMIDPETGW